MKCLGVLTVLALALALALTNAQSACGPRVRRNWDSMSEADKSTYKGALAAAMDSGAYIKFVEIHTEMRSEMEAHKQCMFIYWHRLFLVVFENMLRGQGPEFACVTIPYFNWMEASNKALTGECKTLGDCSRIMQELGGFRGSSAPKTVIINGRNVTGTCIAEAPLNHFCQSSSTTGAACAGCLPRGNWGSAKIPASISYASVIGQVFNGTNIEKVSRTVERGCHADIHASLSSTMSMFQSPADPIFWSHHAMLDALLTIFHKCRVGTRRMTFEQKAADPVAWASCKRRVGQRATGAPFKPTDVVTMRTGEHGADPVEGNKDPLIGQYFEGVPNRFAALMDGSDLGASSYTYEINGLLATMYNNCGAMAITNPATPVPAATTASSAATTRPTTNAPSTTAPTTVAPPSTTNTPASTTVTPATTAPRTSNTRSQEKRVHGIRSFFDWFFGQVMPKTPRARRRLSSCRTAPTSEQNEAEKTKPPASSGSIHGEEPAPVVITVNLTRSEKRVLSWYSETLDSNGGHSAENVADMERQVCMFQDQCLGGILDFTDEFKSLWGVQEPRCRTIVNAINSGEQKILDPAWKSTMKAHFGCPHPANEPA
ncbi:hypothetical protein PHYPSEUDO_009142 [Phytophthora pseudosyringae]|uniref:Tyrosinase copper-binding domain-containing protein n=1 Tax=Phytophthora pseudosyringae TaxID=221518 RepID=A0A8T1VFJ2_9STRA|nr:hypothetical protein PHYPSEUDO_009142 [Phytophthora pseudosyringae]